MAPLARPVHLFGMGLFAIVYGIVRAVLLFAVVAAFFDLELPTANFVAALVVLAIASISFVGIGMMTAVLPLISPEKGTQLGFVAQGMLLVVSGVYYPVSVLPEWMQWLADDLAGHVRAGRDPRRDPGRRRADGDVGRDLAAARDRRGLDPARARGVQTRREVCEAAWEAQALRLRSGRGERRRPRGVRRRRERGRARRHPLDVEELRERRRRRGRRLYLLAEARRRARGVAASPAPRTAAGRGFLDCAGPPARRRRGHRHRADRRSSPTTSHRARLRASRARTSTATTPARSRSRTASASRRPIARSSRCESSGTSSRSSRCPRASSS